MKGKGRDERGGYQTPHLLDLLDLQRCRSEIDIASVGTRQHEGKGYEWLVPVSNKSPSTALCIDPPEPFDLLSLRG